MTLSVVIATYNGEQFLREQLDSVLAQTLMPDEIIVSDDGSTDGTWDILEEYRSKYPNLFRLYRNEGEHGPHNNFKYAFQYVTCDLVAPCDQDDIWMPEKLEQSVAALNEKTSLVFCQEQIQFESGRKELLPHTLRPLHQCIFGNEIYGHLVVCRREVLDVFAVAPEITYDWGMALYAAAESSGVGIDYIGCIWRRHDRVVTSALSEHNPVRIEIMNKWKKWYRALSMVAKGINSSVVARRMHSISTILSWRLSANVNRTKKTYTYLYLCEQVTHCIEMQSVCSLCHAGFLYAKIMRMQDNYRTSSIRERVGRLCYAFCFPANWWYDYHKHDSL